MTDDLRTSTPTSPPPERPGRNRRWLVGAAGGGVLAAIVVAASLAGGSTGIGLSFTGDASARSSSGPAASGDPITFSFTGSAQSITVPDGTTTARVQIAGAQGGVAYGTIFGKPATGGGQGYTMTVNLPVRAGEVFTVGVGGQGATANRNQGPGGGGWGLDNFNGGNGGHSKGQEDDGAGGGGASVIKIDGTTVLIAGAGGGQVNDGGALHGSGGAGGGTDVMDFGGTGGAANGPADRGGRGGANYLGPMNKTGQDAAGNNHGAGAGGGGGLYNGEGGKNWTQVGPAGGGGTSYIDLSRKGTILSSCACRSGHGSIIITWNPIS